MAKERFQITLNSTLVKYARQMMKPLGHDSLSEYLDSLIRAEAEARGITGQPAQLQDAPNSAPATKFLPAPVPAGKPVSYWRGKHLARKH
jgi:hypothetical protein